MKDIAVNRKAYHDFFIEETYEAGMALLGSEIKSLRKGKVSLKEAYVSFSGGEAFVKGMHIAKGFTCIPLRVYLKDGRAKLEIALAKAKTLYDKRESDKKRDMDRMAKQAVRI